MILCALSSHFLDGNAAAARKNVGKHRHRLEEASSLGETGGLIWSDTQQACLTAISLFKKTIYGTI